MTETTAATAAREKIEAFAYPPTHQYDPETLTARGPLYERVRTIERLCPGFFRADRWLDVGANKGFFSLRAARESREVVALEPDQAALDTWASICPPNVKQVCGTFATFDDPEVFDMVWIGNGPHYLYREDPGYIEHVIRLAFDILVMEGPVGRRCPDVRDWDRVQEEADLIGALTGKWPGKPRYFELLGRADSPTYTPARAIWVFRRREF